ncbi:MULTISPECIES: VOC family protein [unclassified Streptomyces]|uniref:VOC family protein n=1 Tax=unclassified Streptomyces TaxID=2593676 RepID=UPI002E288546|nr:VOC family protein [Streptomyces sp. NBC_00223]
MTDAPSRRPPGTPCWASLMAHRADRAREFYGALFGWKFRPGPRELGPYVLAELNGQRIAGIGEGAASPYRPVAWTTMLAADDVDQAAETVRECGGTVGIGPLNAGEEGRMALAVDPVGAVFGIWQGERMAGADLTGVPGTVLWSKLVTQECVRVATFYQDVFGFGIEPSPGGEPYRRVLTVHGRPMAGVQHVGHQVVRDRGAHWVTYFAVSDTDAAARRVTALGGKVLEEPHDSRHGRLARVADPEGGTFSLLARPA